MHCGFEFRPINYVSLMKLLFKLPWVYTYANSYFSHHMCMCEYIWGALLYAWEQVLMLYYIQSRCCMKIQKYIEIFKFCTTSL